MYNELLEKYTEKLIKEVEIKTALGFLEYVIDEKIKEEPPLDAFKINLGMDLIGGANGV